jgi:hypothetical protein
MSGKRRVPILTSGTISSSTGVNSYLAVFVDDYLSATVEYISTGFVGDIIFEASNDAIGDAYTGVWDGTSGTWKTIQAQRSNASNIESSFTLSGDIAYIWSIPLGFRWFRIRCSALTSGTSLWYIKPQYGYFAMFRAGTSTTISAGQGASGATASGNPVRIATRGATANPTAVTNGQAVEVLSTVLGALVNKPYSIPELDWSYASATGGITNTTTAVTLKTASGAGIRNYITALQISSDALGVATEVVIRDGAAGTVLWRQKIGTAGLGGGLSIQLPSPIKSTANTLLEVATLTATVTGGIFINAQGYTAP